MPPVFEHIESFSFEDLKCREKDTAQAIMEAMEDIASCLSREAVWPSNEYLRDKIRYRDLILEYPDRFHNFGRVFIARDPEHQEIIGFALCFDDLFRQKHKNWSFPLGFCHQFFQHDIPYLKDLDALNDFCYCFQLAVTPDSQREGWADLLLDSIETFYDGQVVFLAASVHENHLSTINLLQERNRKVNRWKPKSESDFHYLFLDHYFDEHEIEGHWFRVIQILNNRLFAKRINSTILPRAYNTIIPIQLNQAIINVNRIIKHLDAKVLWSSFFNASQHLRERYGMGRGNHGFFEALLEADVEGYQFVKPLLKEITGYLREKDNASPEVASLTQSFRKDSYELFFFSETEDHEMNSFNNPLSVSIDHPKDSLRQLLYEKNISISESEVFLNSRQKNEWYRKLVKAAKARSYPEDYEEWKPWKDQLCLSDDEELKLFLGVQLYDGAVQVEKLEDVQFTKEEFKGLVNRIHTRKILPQEELDRWEKFLQLHRTLYRIDSKPLKNPEQYWWCHAIIPINFSKGDNVIGIMFSFRCKKVPRTHEEFSSRMNNLAFLVSNALSKNLLNILIKLRERDAFDAANRYAIAAVSSRNLAHNLGSHILPNLATSESLEELRDQIFFKSFTKELAHFNSFIRTRTILLADLVTSAPVGAVGRWLNGDLIYSFNEQKILKRFISGTHIEQVEIIFYNGIEGDHRQDVMVQIPNGDLGVSAFFILLENIIRNTAKYEDYSDATVLKIGIGLLESKERGESIVIHDFVDRPKALLKETVEKVNDNLQRSYATGGYKIKSFGWGLMEMKAAASYLRKKIPGQLDRDQNGEGHIHFVEAFHYQLNPDLIQGGGVKEKSNVLAYRLYFKRPRNAIIVNDNGQFNEFEEGKVKSAGIKVMSMEELRTDISTVHSHQFILCFSKACKEMISLHKRFPLRCILIEEEEVIREIQRLLRSFDPDEWNAYLWKFWLDVYCASRGSTHSDENLWFLEEGDSRKKEVALQDAKDLLVYDSHGEFIERKLGVSPDQVGYYQPYSSVDITGRIWSNQNTLRTNQKRGLRCQFYEAAITNVLVVDERLQREARRISEVSREDYFFELRRLNIFLPDPLEDGIDLLNRDSGPELEFWLAEYIRSMKVDFLVIHLGLLESWIGSKMENIINWLQENVLQHDPSIEVVIISGRGKPHEFPPKFCFQPVNNISEYIVGNLSKYHLTQMLFSSRTQISY